MIYPAPHLCPRASARLSVMAPHGHRGASERLRPALPRIESRPAAARSVCSGSGFPQWGEMHGGEIIAHLEGRVTARRMAILEGMKHAAVLS